MTVFHISSRDNSVSDLLTRWGNETQLNVARCSVILDYSYGQSDVEEDEFYAGVLDGSEQEEDFSYKPEESEEEYRIANGEDWVKNMEKEDQHLRNISVGKFKVRGSTIQQSPIYDPGDFTRSRKELQESVNTELDDLFIGEYISYLSPFYPNKERKNFDEREVKAAQKALPEDFIQKCMVTDGLLYFNKHLVIPLELAVRYIVVNHTLKGHPSKEAEKKYLAQVYFHGLKKRELNRMLTGFRGKCLHCNRTPRIIRHPYNLTKLARRPREILRSDYLYVNSVGYILVIMDSATRKLQLMFTEKADAATMVQSLLDWRANYGFLESFLLVTDNGSHFVNKLLNKLSKAVGFAQSFSISYSPWTNGAIEVINSAILGYLRSMISQYGLHETEWPNLLPLISYLINNKPMERRCNATPNELFMYFCLNETIYLKDSKHFSVYLGGRLVQPNNTDDLLKEVDNILGILEEKYSKVYDQVKLRRELDNKRKDPRYSLIFSVQCQGLRFSFRGRHAERSGEDQTHMDRALPNCGRDLPKCLFG
eukprot:snap_masked-scaffold_81-processed-gene-0.31-mRNA-1 protein AED:0.44 eAED:0.44 QI:0/-1/0/1/-1/1/1/0/537